MSRAKRSRIRKSIKVHDRRAQDLPLNAQVAAVEIDAAFGRYEIREYHEHVVEQNPEGTGAQMALAASRA